MRIICYMFFLYGSIAFSQVIVGTTAPTDASLYISNTGNSSLFIIENDNEKVLDIKDTKIGIKREAKNNLVDIDVKDQSDLLININLNSEYTSNSLRLGVNSQGDIVTTIYKVGDIIFKETKNTLRLNNTIVRDTDNQVFLTPGTYKMDVLVRYSSMSTTDIKIGFVAPIDANGYFTGNGLYGTFTTTTAADEALPFVYSNIHDGFVVFGGEDNTSDKILNGSLKGFITIKTAGYLNLRYLQQAGSGFNTTVYPNSYLKFERIQ